MKKIAYSILGLISFFPIYVAPGAVKKIDDYLNKKIIPLEKAMIAYANLCACEKKVINNKLLLATGSILPAIILHAFYKRPINSRNLGIMSAALASAGYVSFQCINTSLMMLKTANAINSTSFLANQNCKHYPVPQYNSLFDHTTVKVGIALGTQSLLIFGSAMHLLRDNQLTNEKKIGFFLKKSPLRLRYLLSTFLIGISTLFGKLSYQAVFQGVANHNIETQHNLYETLQKTEASTQKTTPK